MHKNILVTGGLSALALMGVPTIENLLVRLG